ncbi:restriction endonuclease subunit S [Mediterranea massiliensis]|uniref:restriction endonuclease subunit S n=1 Tax=Mediterranea massiliensis TaxID=1841865 RepID=UPI0025A43602|nr:restriction endonuclease subunit S [Mediterranea massiliensis]MDM8337695.1 restriction endonuclease subunit S [Mediterranea massiliensis]
MSQFIEMFSKYSSETPWYKLLTIINGKAYPEEYNNIGTYPICGSAGIMYYGERKLCDANTIILGRKGNINHPIYMESDYWIVDTAFCLDVNKSILHPKYFYYWCCQYDFTKLNKQGVLPSLTRKDLEKIEMSVPPMVEQKKFVSIVEQADKSKFGDFKSQFIEMYHKTHNTQTLESVCAIISKGITPKYVDFSSVAVVNQACIQWDGQHLENIKYHNEEIPLKKRTLQTGDVLLNATGTGTLGRCCVFNCPSNDNIYINDGHVIALATDKSILLPEVLNAYLSLNDTQAEIYRLYVTGSTNQVDIVFSDIKKMKVPVPNIDDQISFVKILNQADKSKSYVRIALKSLESMLGYCIRQVA